MRPGDALTPAASPTRIRGSESRTLSALTHHEGENNVPEYGRTLTLLNIFTQKALSVT